ncbi:MAG: alpha/beta hydrolase [Bacteroidota bacterium]
MLRTKNFFCGFFILLCFSIALSHAQNQEEAIELEIENGSVKGTLLVPQTDKKLPVALIIAGSGPTDRNGNNMMMTNNHLKLLAEGLAEKGIASLRYDKRGVGKSALQNFDELDLRFEDYANDAVGWLRQLQSDTRFSKLILIGHSEGSLLGMLACQHVNVTQFISLAGAGQNASALLKEQLGKQSPSLLEEALPIFDKLEHGETVEEVPMPLFSIFRPSVQPYMISWIKYDPKMEISKLEVPILIIHGTTDIQLEVSEAKLLSEGNPKAQLKIIEGMNHILKEADEAYLPNLQTYSNPDLPLAKGLMDLLADFILE